MNIEQRSAGAHVFKLLAEGRRLDSTRNLVTPREVNITHNVVFGALGSAQVQMGSNVTVIAAIKPEFGPVDPLMPNEGRVTVDVRFSPISGNSSGGPGSSSIGTGVTALLTEDQHRRRLAHFIKTALVPSFLDLEQLIITPGVACWVLNVDVLVLEHDGGLVDATMTAIVAALEAVVLPEAILPDGETKTVETPLRLKAYPQCTTFAVVSNTTIQDPTFDELSVASNEVCVVTAGTSTLRKNSDSISSSSPQKNGAALLGFHVLGGRPCEDSRLQEMMVLASQERRSN